MHVKYEKDTVKHVFVTCTLKSWKIKTKPKVNTRCQYMQQNLVLLLPCITHLFCLK